MIVNPYLASSTRSTPNDKPQRHVPSSVCTWAVIGGCFALAQYAVAISTGLSITLVYSFPSFYPLRGIFYFNVLYGFCIQCVLYGVIIGAFAGTGRALLGGTIVLALHALLVVICPMLT